MVDLFGLQITDECLPSILNLQHLEDLVLEGCFGMDDKSLEVLKSGCKSLKVFIADFRMLFDCVCFFNLWRYLGTLCNV